MDKGFSGDSGTKLVRAPRLPPLTCANGNPQSSENRQAGSRSDIREENERGIDCRKKAHRPAYCAEGRSDPRRPAQ